MLEKSQVIKFLRGEGSDHKNRIIEYIIAYEDYRWDECHDFIQWLFPLPVASNFFKGEGCPILTHLDVEYGRDSNEVKAGLMMGVKRFVTFLGLEQRHSTNFIRAKNFDNQAKFWLRANDHNHLRINRMLQCLVLFGLDEVARAIFKCLSLIKCDFPDCITDETMVYWRNALTGYSY